MAHRPHPRNASTNAALGPWSTCDDCGFIYSHSKLRFNFQFMGGPTPMSTGFLVCPRCQDDLNYQQSLLVLPPDPPVTFNTRPENYTVDETNWLVTQDGDIISTDNDEPITTNIPSPSTDANTTHLVSSMDYPSGSVATIYLDLFDGAPAAGGISVLALITGSSTRTDIGPDLETSAQLIATNTDVLVVTTSCLDTVNVTHVGLYSAATAGSLLASGTVSASQLPVAQGVVVQFNALGLSIDLS